MRANCLVTKLKGSVDNPNLPRLGHIVVRLAANVNEEYRSLGFSQHVISLISGELTLKATSTGEVYTLPATIPAKTNLTFVTGANGAVIDISDKNSIDNLSVFGMSEDTILTKEFAVFNKPIYFLTSTISACRGNLVGKWSDIIDVPYGNVSSIDIRNTPNVEGELKDFAPWNPNCVSIHLENSAVTGSIEEYIQALRLTNRTQPSKIDFTAGLCHITFNGENVTNTHGDIIWTENTITYNRVTVNA